MYFVYILRCSDGTYYTGITTDVERRIRQHNGELKGGAKYTAARQPVRLLAQSSPIENRSKASKMEYQVKQQKRSEKVLFLTTYTAEPT